MDIKDIINMSLDEFNRLTKEELLSIANIATSAANKRIKRLSKQEVTPPIYSELMQRRAIKESMTRSEQNIPKFSTQGLRKGGISKVRSFVADVRRFLSTKTTTVTGYKEWREKQKTILPTEVYGDPERESAFWRGYTRFMQEEHKEQLYTSEQVVTWLRQNVSGDDDITPDKITEKLNNADERGYIGNETIQEFNELIPTDGDLPF